MESRPGIYSRIESHNTSELVLTLVTARAHTIGITKPSSALAMDYTVNDRLKTF